MSNRRLRIALGEVHASDGTPPALRLECDAYAGHLQAAGIEVIELAGLACLGARDDSGAPVDTLALRADSEAEMLAIACHELGQLAPGREPCKHEVYLDGGQFEITALLTGEQVILRAGVYRDPFDPQDPGNTRMSPARYIGIWRAVAAALEEPVATSPQHQQPRSWADRLERAARDAVEEHETGSRPVQSSANVDELVSLLGEIIRDEALPDSPGHAADALHRLEAMFDDVVSEGNRSAQPVATALHQLREIVEGLTPSDDATVDPLARLLPPSSGRARETDAERARRLDRIAREDIAASMKKLGLQDD